MHESDEVLIRILAMTDSVFIPLRHWIGRAGSNLYCARQAYRARGVPWHSETPEATEQKRRQRTIRALADDSLLGLYRPAVKTLSARLTDRGEGRARALCNLPTLSDSIAMMRRIASLSKRPPRLLTHKWISEFDLIPVRAGMKGWGRYAAGVEEQLLPVLLRGLVESNSDHDGRVSYCITAAGWTALDDGIEAPADDQVKAHPEASNLWLQSMEAARAKLESGPAIEPREIGLIPLPVHIEGLKLG